MKENICPICGAHTKPLANTPELALHICAECWHIRAFHKTIPLDDTDYHKRNTASLFLDAIKNTRIRQAKVIIRQLSKLNISSNYFYDFGAGRCWFLQELKASGAKILAGSDTSPLSVRQMEEMGVVSIPAAIAHGAITIAPSDFRAQTLSFLDVIEHFEAPHLASNIQNIARGFPTLENIVFKVPISQGSLFKAALFLSRLGFHGPLHQLFQTGTNPPHFHYFSRKSLDLLVKKIGFRTIKAIDEVDFDQLSNRTTPLMKLPAPLKFFIDKCLQFISYGPLANSRIVFSSKS